MKDTENVFTGDEPKVIQNDREDELVSSAIEFLSASKKDPNREVKKGNIEENIEKRKDFHAQLPTGKKPLMKASLYAIMNRKIRINGVKNPRIDTARDEFEAEVAKAVLKEGLKDINFPRLHKSIYQKYENEGTAFVVILKENGKLKEYVIPFFDFFYDPNGTDLSDEHLGFYEDNMRWVGFRRVLKRASFDKEYPEWSDKVASGSPLDSSEQKEESLTETGEMEFDWDMDSDVEIFYMISLVNSEPVLIQIAGSSATRIAEESGDQYEYRADNGEPIIPAVLFHFSDEKVGAMSASMVDFVKDGAETIKKNLNHILQNTSRIVNAPTYIFGSADDAEIDEIMNYYSMQDAGYAPVIQRKDPNLDIKALAPQDATATYKNVKNEVYDDLSERTGILLRKNDNDPSTKVGIFVRQDRDEGQAIRIIDGRNEGAFQRLAYIVYWLKKTLPMKKVSMSLGGDLGDVELSPKEIRVMLKDFDPEWTVDTDMDMKLTFQEKVRARDVIANDLFMLMQANIKPEVAEAIGRSYYRKAVMLGLGKDYTEKDFVDASSAPGTRELEPNELLSNPIEPEGIANEPKALAQTT